MVELTVSIVNHNSVEPLRTCLESLLPNLVGITHQIYVVDNFCQERAGPMLAARFPQVKVLSNDQTLGFGANHNQVLRLVQETSDFVLVLNPDTVLPPQTVRTLVEFMKTQPQAAACSPVLVDEKGKQFPLPRQALKPHRDALLEALYISNATTLFQSLETLRSLNAKPGSKSSNSTHHQPHSNTPAPQAVAREVILGACMLFRAEALREVGLFDEDYFLYFEEYDWCLRAGKNKWQVYLLPDASVLHSQGYSTRHSDYLRYLRISVESWLIFYRKHYGRGTVHLLRVWITLVAAINFFRWTILVRLQPHRRDGLNAWRSFSLQLIKNIWQQKNGAPVPVSEISFTP